MEDLVCETVSGEDQNAFNMQNLIIENGPAKLKGGAKLEPKGKLKIVVSRIEEYNSVLNLLSSSKITGQFNDHNK